MNGRHLSRALSFVDRLDNPILKLHFHSNFVQQEVKKDDDVPRFSTFRCEQCASNEVKIKAVQKRREPQQQKKKRSSRISKVKTRIVLQCKLCSVKCKTVTLKPREKQKGLKKQKEKEDKSNLMEVIVTEAQLSVQSSTSKKKKRKKKDLSAGLTIPKSLQKPTTISKPPFGGGGGDGGKPMDPKLLKMLKASAKDLETKTSKLQSFLSRD